MTNNSLKDEIPAPAQHTAPLPPATLQLATVRQGYILTQRKYIFQITKHLLLYVLTIDLIHIAFMDLISF